MSNVEEINAGPEPSEKAHIGVDGQIVRLFFVMMLMSLLAFFFQRTPGEPVEATFLDGVRDGVAGGGVSRSIIGAVLFGLIAAFHRSRVSILGAVLHLFMAAFHFQHFIASFPTLNEALIVAIPATIRCLVLSPATWGEYILVYSVYCTWCTQGDREIDASVT